MPYALKLSDEAAEDLRNLIESLLPPRRRAALDGVERALQRLASNPRLARPGPLKRPTFEIRFVAGRVHYHWACTFACSEDETAIIVTHIYGVDL